MTISENTWFFYLIFAVFSLLFRREALNLQSQIISFEL